jgi:hypothetical protein
MKTINIRIAICAGFLVSAKRTAQPSEAADAYRKALATDATDFEARMRLGELAKKAPTR